MPEDKADQHKNDRQSGTKEFFFHHFCPPPVSLIS